MCFPAPLRSSKGPPEVGKGRAPTEACMPTLLSGSAQLSFLKRTKLTWPLARAQGHQVPAATGQEQRQGQVRLGEQRLSRFHRGPGPDGGSHPQLSPAGISLISCSRWPGVSHWKPPAHSGFHIRRAPGGLGNVPTRSFPPRGCRSEMGSPACGPRGPGPARPRR